MIISKKTKNGFTLLEMLVYIAIFGIIFTAISSLILWLIYTNTKAQVIRETYDSGRMALERMNKEIKEAMYIYDPTTTSTQLSLKVIREAMRYNIDSELVSYVDFYICGNQICLKEEQKDPSALTSPKVNVDSLIFTKVMVGQIPSVQIDLALSYNNSSGKPEYDASIQLKTTVSLRPFSYTRDYVY